MANDITQGFGQEQGTVPAPPQEQPVPPLGAAPNIVSSGIDASTDSIDSDIDALLAGLDAGGQRSPELDDAQSEPPTSGVSTEDILAKSPDAHEKIIDYCRSVIDAGMTSRDEVMRKWSENYSTFLGTRSSRSWAVGNDNAASSEFKGINEDLVQEHVDLLSSHVVEVFNSDTKPFKLRQNSSETVKHVLNIEDILQGDGAENGYANELLMFVRAAFVYGTGFMWLRYQEIEKINRHTGDRYMCKSTRAMAVSPFDVFTDHSVPFYKVAEKGSYAFRRMFMTYAQVREMWPEADLAKLNGTSLSNSMSMEDFGRTFARNGFYGTSNDNLQWRDEVTSEHGNNTEDGTLGFLNQSAGGVMITEAMTSFDRNNTILGDSKDDPNMGVLSDESHRPLDSNDTRIVRIEEGVIRVNPKVFGIESDDDADNAMMFSVVIVNGSMIAEILPYEPAHGMLPLIAAEPYAMPEEYGALGVADKLRDLQSAISWLLESRMGNVEDMTAQQYVFNPRLIDARQINQQEHGQLIPMTPHSLNYSPDHAIRALPTENVTQTNFSDMAAIRDIADRKTGVTDILRGDTSSGSATGSRLSNANSTTRIVALVKAIDAQAIQRITTQMASNIMQFYTHEDYVLRVGEHAALDSDQFVGMNVASVTPSDGTLPSTRVDRGNNVQHFFTMVATNPALATQFDLPRIAVRFAEEVGLKGMENYRITAKPEYESEALANQLNTQALNAIQGGTNANAPTTGQPGTADGTLGALGGSPAGGNQPPAAATASPATNGGNPFGNEH